MTSGYGINPLMGGFGYDWASLMNDKYFQNALMSPNINFKGYSDASSKVESPSNTGASSNSDGKIPVTTPPKNDSGSGIGTLTTVGGLGIATCGALYMLKKGDYGKASKVVKSWFGENKTVSSVTDTLKRLTAVKNKDGDIRFMIPGKTTKMDGAAAKTFAEENCIKESISLQRQKFNPTSSAIEEFTCVSTENQYTIKVKDGAITSIKDKYGKEVYTELANAVSGSDEAKILESFEKVLKELTKEKDADKAVLDTISGIKYTNTFGDDVLNLSLAKCEGDPVLDYFTTLQRFKFSDPEMQALKLEADERVFAEFASNGLLKKKKLADGLTVATFSKKVDGVNEYCFEGRKLVKIKKADGNELPEGSAGYIELANKYEKDINNVVKKVFEDRTEIPIGATIIPE